MDCAIQIATYGQKQALRVKEELEMQARFTEALLKDLAGIDFPADRIFSQAESGRPKTEVLAMLQDRHPGTEYYFIEDKLGTLEKVGTAQTHLILNAL